MKDIYTLAYNLPVKNNAVTDPFGDTGTVY